MFGHNEQRRRVKGEPLQVQSIFSTIQGEGPFAGDRAVFIRLTGCNLRCWFCDTEWNDDGDMTMTPFECAEEARNLSDGHDLVVITGGEPCRQDLDQLFDALRYQHFSRIQVETAGSFWQDCLEAPDVTVVVSPKTLGVHPKFREIEAHWKYVICAEQIDREDGLPTGSTQRGQSNLPVARPPEGAQVYLQPMDEYDEQKNARNQHAMVWSAITFGYRAGLQLHKIFGLS